MIRFDVNGSDHVNLLNNERIFMLYIYIYIEEYNNGGIVILLKDIEDLELIDEIIELLDFFMKYINIKYDNVIKELRLL